MSEPTKIADTIVDFLADPYWRRKQAFSIEFTPADWTLIEKVIRGGEFRRMADVADKSQERAIEAIQQNLELQRDAARWRWWAGRTGAVNNELKFPVPDVNRHLVGVNLMRGSVYEHYAKAVDAAIEREGRAA